MSPVLPARNAWITLVDTAVNVRLEKPEMIVIKVSESVADPGFPRWDGWRIPLSLVQKTCHLARLLPRTA